MNGMVTIHDVAKLAGVSVSTVSRVINGYSNVSEKTKMVVSEAVEQLGFQPNNFAQSLITKRTKMVAVIVPELTNSFYIDVILGIENILKPLGYHQLLFATSNLAENEVEVASSIFVKMTDGVIVVPCVKDLSIYENFKNRIVLVDRYLPEMLTHSVVVDNYGGSYDITKLLIEYGHKKIAMINGDELFNHGQERKAGFISALLDHNLGLEAGYYRNGSFTEEHGYKSMEYFMQMEDKPTAVYCANNSICIGALKYLNDYGYMIGEDISLVGFDDHEYATFVKPGITVVDRPTTKMGEYAGQCIVDLIEGNEKVSTMKRKVFKVDIIERGSIKKLN